MPADIQIFTLEEANALARELRPGLVRLLELKAELDRVEVRIEVLRLTVSAGGNDHNPEAQELGELQWQRGKIAGNISTEIHHIQETGALLKDVDQGLLDFYTLVGDRLVFLCWKHDESEITHWHTLEAGFAGRQPLTNINELE
ncbi:MAG TPA: DUF2203 domain-containing protein [Candidatus Sulfotelmatobacter sp.]|nr:DUF2203 domain-containing protein [Candidatus Sulfotelmatobacter sp.]